MFIVTCVTYAKAEAGGKEVETSSAENGEIRLVWKNAADGDVLTVTVQLTEPAAVRCSGDDALRLLYAAGVAVDAGTAVESVTLLYEDGSAALVRSGGAFYGECDAAAVVSLSIRYDGGNTVVLERSLFELREGNGALELVPAVAVQLTEPAAVRCSSDDALRLLYAAGVAVDAGTAIESVTLLCEDGSAALTRSGGAFYGECDAAAVVSLSIRYDGGNTAVLERSLFELREGSGALELVPAVAVHLLRFYDGQELVGLRAVFGGAEAGALPKAPRDAAAFAGWYCGGLLLTEDTRITSDLTLQAHFAEQITEPEETPGSGLQL